MSRLEELIEELCPDGVEYKKLGDLCSVKGRIGWQRLKKSEYLTEGDYYLITGVDIRSDNRVDFQSCYYVSKERYDLDKNIQLQNDDIILTKDGTIGKVAFIEGMDKPAVLNSHLFVIRDCSGELIPKFLMYVLLSNSFKDFIKKNQTKGTIPGLTQATIINFVMPVPPLEVQREIVLILDNFTELTEELTEELTARKQQYEYYMGEMLRFHDDEVTYLRLGECCHLEKGNTPIQKTISGEYPLVVTTSERKTSNKYQFNKPSVCIPLISSRGHGVASLNQIYYQEGKFALGNILCAVIPINEKFLCAKFLYYYLSYKKNYLLVPLMRGGANVSMTVDSLKHVKIPIPEIDIQYKIVENLDKYDELCNDTAFGLPAEIEARQKQYAYYRDKLLSFKGYRG